MRVTARINKIDDIEVTLTVTMTVNHWKQLREQVKETWPGWDFTRHITDAISKLETTAFISSDPDIK